ncbi:uncharacterized protein LOC144526599 isoform X1 [Sander vitreus]
MYKSVLLVLLGLQVFLLITSFTSADAAALVPVDQRQQDSPDLLEGVSVHERERRRQRNKRQASNCRLRPGACSSIGRIDLNGKDKKIPNTPNPPPLLALDKTRVKTEQA